MRLVLLLCVFCITLVEGTQKGNRNLLSASCSAHSECAEGTYCFHEGTCDPCSECCANTDGIDETCGTCSCEAPPPPPVCVESELIRVYTSAIQNTFNQSCSEPFQNYLSNSVPVYRDTFCQCAPAMPEEDIGVLRCLMSDTDEKTYYDSYFCPGTPPSPSPYAPCFEVDADNWDDAKSETNDYDEIICKPEWERCFNDFVVESKNETLFYDCIDEIRKYKYPVGHRSLYPSFVQETRNHNCTAHVGCGVHLGQYCNAETRMCELCEGCCKQRTKPLDGVCPGWCLCDHEDEADPIQNVPTCREAYSVYEEHKCCDDKNKLLDVPLDCSNVTDLKQEIASLEPELQTCKASLHTITAQNIMDCSEAHFELGTDVNSGYFDNLWLGGAPVYANGMSGAGANYFNNAIQFGLHTHIPSAPDQETLLSDSCKAFQSMVASNLVYSHYTNDPCGVVFTRIKRMLEMYDTDPRARNLTRVNLDDKAEDAPITNVTLRTCVDLKRHYQNKACCEPNPQLLECSTASVTQLKEQRDDLWIRLQSCKIDVRRMTAHTLIILTDWVLMMEAVVPETGDPFRSANSGLNGVIDNVVALTRAVNQNGMISEDNRGQVVNEIVGIMNEYGPMYHDSDGEIHDIIVNRITAVLKENGS